MSEDKLGRKMQDLVLENNVELSDDEKVVELEINLISPNPEQPRTVFNKESIEELALSIREHGLIQPIIVKKRKDGYVLVAGERRVRAFRKLGETTIPAIVRGYNTVDFAELALLENLQREDLTPIEEAMAYKNIIDNTAMTHEQLGQKVGKSRVHITNMLGLLKLPAIVIEDVNQKRLTMGHARSLSKIENMKLLIDLRNRVISESLSVRELEALIRNNKSTKKDKRETFVYNKYKGQFNEVFQDKFKYRLSNKSLTVSFKSEEELIAILDFLKRG
jgi:ParB family chromosome partitioning protein